MAALLNHPMKVSLLLSKCPLQHKAPQEMFQKHKLSWKWCKVFFQVEYLDPLVSSNCPSLAMTTRFAYILSELHFSCCPDECLTLCLCVWLWCSKAVFTLVACFFSAHWKWVQMRWAYKFDLWHHKIVWSSILFQYLTYTRVMWKLKVSSVLTLFVTLFGCHPSWLPDCEVITPAG